MPPRRTFQRYSGLQIEIVKENSIRIQYTLTVEKATRCMNIPRFRHKILVWYKKNKRDMPWRKTKNPYKILVSEVMLQQTQVSRALPKYKEFLQAFPTPKALARASDKKLLYVWEGLGYWRRALFLKETATRIERTYKGRFPRDINVLEALPGIGPYTARALACFAFGNSEAFLDTNIRRIYLHFFFKNRKGISDQEILAIAKVAVWYRNPREWHYALFDYGAEVLKDKKINRKSLHYHRQSPFAGSFRSFRTNAIRFLLASPQNKVSHKKLEDMLKKTLTKTSYTPAQVLGSLVKDKLVKKSSTHYFL